LNSHLVLGQFLKYGRKNKKERKRARKSKTFSRLFIGVRDENASGKNRRRRRRSSDKTELVRHRSVQRGGAQGVNLGGK